MCEFCECDCWLYEELLPTGRLHLNHRIGVDEEHKELYSTIYDCENDEVENVRINIKYCPMCGREL